MIKHVYANTLTIRPSGSIPPGQQIPITKTGMAKILPNISNANAAVAQRRIFLFEPNFKE
jgi:hypothetical protein